MFDLCKYKDILGRPNEGVHSFRIFNIAIVDVLLTILAAYILSIFTKFNLIYTTILHRPERKMRQNAVMIYIFYNYVSGSFLNVPL